MFRIHLPPPASPVQLIRARLSTPIPAGHAPSRAPAIGGKLMRPLRSRYSRPELARQEGRQTPVPQAPQEAGSSPSCACHRQAEKLRRCQAGDHAPGSSIVSTRASITGPKTPINRPDDGEKHQIAGEVVVRADLRQSHGDAQHARDLGIVAAAVRRSGLRVGERMIRGAQAVELADERGAGPAFCP
jgi:hypothetical protein